MSQEYMEVTYDKFTFRVMKDYLYHPEECWVKREGDLVVVGVTDFLQTNAGDVAFIELPEAGKEVKQGDEAGVIETIKTTVTLIAPVSGEIVEVNTALEDDPQLINSDAYGEGWIFKIRPSAWDRDAEKLMIAEAYFPVMEEKIKAALLPHVRQSADYRPVMEEKIKAALEK